MKALRDFLSSPKYLKSLADSLGSPVLAKWAIEDLKAGMPASRTAWERAEAAASGGGPGIPKAWLMIIPNANPIAIVYPLTLALRLGHKVYVRRTTSQSKAPDNLFLDFMHHKFHPQLELLAPSYRLGQTPLPEDVEAILAYGSNDTIAALKRLSSKPVQGFGDALCAAIISARDLKRDPHGTARLLVRDALSLAQRGCMSVRTTVVLGKLGDHSRQEWLLDVRSKAHARTRGALDAATETALDHEVCAWIARGAEILPRRALDEPLVPYQHEQVGPGLTLTAERPYVIPLTFSDNAAVTEVAAKLRVLLPTLRHLSLSSSLLREVESGSAGLEGLRLASLGYANRVPWDGTHEGKPLFNLERPSLA